jgi:hypothetical protein
MPETSYEGSPLFTCLLAFNRAGVRDLNAANKLLCTRIGGRSFEHGDFQTCHTDSICLVTDKLVRLNQIGNRL